MFLEGQQIGPYTLVRKIGRGGFGEVWLAERRTELLTTLVAVKLPIQEQVNIEAIKQEAGHWAKASGHQNVLPIIEANIYDGQVIIVSEFAPDGSLEEKLESEGKFSAKKAVETTVDILRGLEFLHSRQIIHRDIKPANILLQNDTPRLADFGISRVIKTTALSTAIVGTPKYMSPEAFDGKRTIQTDIWSVGVILHQLLSGGFPFPQENPTEIMWAVVSKEPESLPVTIPSSLHQIVAKALAKFPKARYQSAGEMREELHEVLLKMSYPSAKEKEIRSLSQDSPTEPLGNKTKAAIQSFAESDYTIKQTDEMPLAVTELLNTQSKVVSKPITTEAKILANSTQETRKKNNSLFIYSGVAVLILLTSVLGFTSYYFWSKSQILPDKNVPVTTEVKTPNIPILAFEENRRNVDRNPRQFIAANADNPQDAEDFYLLGRAYLLTGNYSEAKQAFIESKNRIPQTDIVNAKILANDIAMSLAIIDDPFAQNYFEKGISENNAPQNSGNTTNSNASNLNPVSNR